jgi:DNA-directed RNA polymerase subunit omega
VTRGEGEAINLVFRDDRSYNDPPAEYIGQLDAKLMRNDYLQAALNIIDDPNILVNVISARVKQLRRGNRALVQSLEKLSAEDTALREVAEGKISYELPTAGEMLVTAAVPTATASRTAALRIS